MGCCCCCCSRFCSNTPKAVYTHTTFKQGYLPEGPAVDTLHPITLKSFKKVCGRPGQGVWAAKGVWAATRVPRAAHLAVVIPTPCLSHHIISHIVACIPYSSSLMDMHATGAGAFFGPIHCSWHWRRLGSLALRVIHHHHRPRTEQASNNNNNKRPLTPKSMPPAGDEHAKLKT